MKKDYWKMRFDQVEQSQNNKSVNFAKDLEKKYQKAMIEINRKICDWYNRFAINNKISISEAKKLLTKAELEELKWSVAEYIEKGKDNQLTELWTKQLENASAKFHISRLEALKIECQQSLEVATGGMVSNMENTIADVYKDTYYKSCFEIQKGVGVGFNVVKIDDNYVSKIISKPWAVDEINFSTRLWGNKTKLINTLQRELLTMAMTGNAPDKSIEAIQKAMQVSRFNATRLVQTEQAYFTTLAQNDCYKDLDVEQFEVVVTLDDRTCEKCQPQDGKHYPIKDMTAGINAPPFHPLCRCTTCPYFDDMEGYRASRGKDGKTVFTVSANMTYEEWKVMQGV